MQNILSFSSMYLYLTHIQYMKKSLLFLIPMLLVACSRTTPIIQPKTVSQEVSPAPAPEVVVQPAKKQELPPQKVENKDDVVVQKDTSSDPTTDDVAQELDSLINEMTKK